MDLIPNTGDYHSTWLTEMNSGTRLKGTTNHSKKSSLAQNFAMSGVNLIPLQDTALETKTVESDPTDTVSGVGSLPVSGEVASLNRTPISLSGQAQKRQKADKQ